MRPPPVAKNCNPINYLRLQATPRDSYGAKQQRDADVLKGQHLGLPIWL
jgi:hypothetical protein